MTNRLRPLALLAVCMASAACESPPHAGPSAGVAAPFEIASADGSVRRPLELEGQKAAVLFFIGTECPISASYAPQMNLLCDAYSPRGLAFYMVCTDSGLPPEAARQNAEAFGYHCPLLLDGNRRLSGRFGATVTPEAAVVGRDGALLYRGRIDNWFVALGQHRFAATTHELRDALDDIAADRPVRTPRTQAVGCAP